MFETLETRRLLSSSPTVSFSGGALTLTGAASAPNQVAVHENLGQVLVQNMATGAQGTFSGVTSITILGGSKNDYISYSGNSVGAVIDGKNGDDMIVISDTGTASSRATGGAGNDSLVVMSSVQTIVAGGGGNDQFFINTNGNPNGEVWAYGQAGRDTFLVYGGEIYTDLEKNEVLLDWR